MANACGYGLVINPEVHGDSTEEVIINALQNEHILKWAYIFHDKECYNEHDMNIRRNELNRSWAEGFDGMEKYASINEYIEARMKEPPHVGDKKPAKWNIVLITDGNISKNEIADIFGISFVFVFSLFDSVRITNSLLELTREDKDSIRLERCQYSIDEVKSNFDIKKYISDANKSKKLGLFKSIFDPYMLFSLAVIIFIIVCAIKYGTMSSSGNYSLLLPGIVGGIGILYIAINIMAMVVSKKKNKHISGIPFIGGFHLLLAGLMSPCKWLALLVLADFTIWSFLYAVFKDCKR